MHGTSLYEAQKAKTLADWEYINKKFRSEEDHSTENYANWHVSVIAYGKKPKYRNKKEYTGSY